MSRAVRTIAALCASLACVAAALGLAAAAAAAQGVSPPQLAVTGASLTVASTGQRLYGYNADKRLLIASTTKMMTALVVLQHVKDLDTVYTAPNWRAAPADSQIGLMPGERMTVHDLMLSLLLPSADDAAMSLAYNVGGGSTRTFVAAMNADAVALGLTHTHYSNPIGLDSPENYSSPYDLTRLAAYMLDRYPFFAQAVRLKRALLRSGSHPRLISNTDTLLGAMPWISGVKTGHTNAAGYILVSSGTQNGLTLVASVLGTSSEAARNANALTLLEYGFAAFHQVTALAANRPVRRLPVSEESLRPAIVPARNWQTVLPKTDRVRVRYRLPKQLSGPLAKGSKVGQAEVLVNGRDAGRVNLIVAQAVPAVPALTQVVHFIFSPTTLGILAVLLGAAVTAAELRRRRPRTMAGKAL